MRKIVRILAIFFLLLFLGGTDIYAQKKNKRVIKADKAFDLEQYDKAAELYKKAYKKTKNRAVKSEIIFKQAECYRMSGNIKRAENYYKRAIKAKYPDVVVYLRYADMLRMQGDLEDAVVQYKKYLELNPTDVQGEIGLKSCDFALKWKDVPTRYNVNLMPVINDRNSDYSPAFGNEEYSELYFTSTRAGGLTDKIDARTGEPFSDVWFTKLNKKGAWSRPIVMPEPINTEANEGSVFLNSRGTAMYITQCKVEKKKDLGCGIYVSKRSGRLWGASQLIQIKVDDNTTIGHPTLSEDESVMIFSSDLSGGYGGKDLWVSVKEKRNRWSRPINLGPLVNTPGDEMFPFLAADGTIYFASDGHVGMGGFDIYKTSADENGAYLLPVNLKSPVNSSFNDFGMIVEKGGERGFLTSNRPGGKGGDDIYEFVLTKLELFVKGVVTDSKTGAIMTGVNVELLGTDGSSKEMKTDNTGSYRFELDALNSYEIIVDTEGYLKKISRETTEGVEMNKTFIVDLSVDPIKKEIILPLIKYDFNKYELRAESIVDLDDLAESLLDNPNVVVALKSHTDFIGSEAQNNKLSQQRADECVAYLVSKGVEIERLVARGLGENEPFVIEEKDGRFKVGDVLTESYINKIRFKKNKEKANQYNRRTSFKVLREDYVPANSDNTSDKN